MGDHRMLRRGAALVAATALLAGIDVGVLRGTASAKTDFDVVNGTVNAGADYVVYFTGVFSNFTPGIIGSTFPLSHSHVDNSPFSEATASPADTGPAGGLAVAGYNTSPPPAPAPQTIAQPQYAESKYPPGTAKTVTVGNPPGPSASALAGATSATASATVADTAAPSGSSASSATRDAQIAGFNAAMTAWRARFLTPAAALSYPMQAASASTPDGTDGDTSSSSVVLDPDRGLLAAGDASLAHASFGGGALVFHSVHTAVSIANPGSPKADVTVTSGDVSVGGVPVSVGADGVTVASAVVPVDSVQTASAQLNAALAAAGVSVGVVAPVVKTFPSRETVSASAATVTVDQPGPPEQKVRHDLGHVEAEDLAVPSVPVLTASLAAPGTLTTVTGGSAPTTRPLTTTYIPGTAGTPGTPGSPATGPGTTIAPSTARASAAQTPPAQLSPRLTAARPRPTWLLLLYLAWQTLLLGAGASLWWWRSAARSAAG